MDSLTFRLLQRASHLPGAKTSKGRSNMRTRGWTEFALGTKAMAQGRRRSGSGGQEARFGGVGRGWSTRRFSDPTIELRHFIL
mmetsp:Transcript_686/g.2640  ORF Transcript_686/g.2640 Transcript_686/m.2640 type:complete len:83 (-) Transcript_686:981-1229(-)